MADGGGQRPVKNSLLSGATAANFFEEEAILVPVSLVDAEEILPPIEEIDLNSDDTSSNRAPVEKEVVDVTPEVEEGHSSRNEEAPAPISLFARASTGVDAFTRLLTGASAAHPSPGGSDTEISVLRAPQMDSVTSITEQEPLIYPPSSIMLGAPTPPASLRRTLTSGADDVLASSSSMFPLQTIDISCLQPASTSTTYMSVASETSSEERTAVANEVGLPLSDPAGTQRAGTQAPMPQPGDQGVAGRSPTGPANPLETTVPNAPTGKN